STCSSSSSISSDGDFEKLRIPLAQPGNSGRGPTLKDLERLELARRPLAMSDIRPDSRRPPQLDIGAARRVEPRASLTSLPDLIRRASTLAKNLDRGRTASRLGVALDPPEGSRESKNPSRQSESISEILASFPPPGFITTPPVSS